MVSLPNGTPRPAHKANHVVSLSEATATAEIYTLSLHDALPIYRQRRQREGRGGSEGSSRGIVRVGDESSEEHTSELQSRPHVVCRLLLEKKQPDRIRRGRRGRGRDRRHHSHLRTVVSPTHHTSE